MVLFEHWYLLRNPSFRRVSAYVSFLHIRIPVRIRRAFYLPECEQGCEYAKTIRYKQGCISFPKIWEGVQLFVFWAVTKLSFVLRKRGLDRHQSVMSSTVKLDNENTETHDPMERCCRNDDTRISATKFPSQLQLLLVAPPLVLVRFWWCVRFI